MAITKEEFLEAFKSLPNGVLEKRRTLLQAHYDSEGRASTATLLGQAVGYEDYRGTNSSYGYLASYLGEALSLDPENAGLGLLCDLARPRALTNKEWILIMKPEFVLALKEAGVIQDKQ